MEEKENINSAGPEKNIIDRYEEGSEEPEKDMISIEDQEGLKIHYSINTEEYSKGFKLFQKKFAYPKNIILTVLFVIIIGLFVEQLFHKGANIGAIATIIFVCLAVIFITWFNTFKAHKSLVSAISQFDDDYYTAVFGDNKIFISTDLKENESEEDRIEPQVIEYDFDMPEALEINDMFLIYIKKKMIYIIPKKYLNEEEKDELRNILAEKLGKRMEISKK